ncbi:TonB-dependent receptor [Fulvivirga maritima]|uniref:SusC/RagA family TonB-linked outer membrane protein n=1 Tax=Fulvivirga maritima TaxID=2904247 RepID=UPI001F35197B|nr:TonB-dependent receptor [Fulvivirga maritima]UII26693.1 TonB-dependent receptor [Fulvivirga maritima]
MKIKCYLLISFLVLTQWAFGQSTITGTVVDGETSDPIPGVNVLVEGTSKGTVTDINGTFSLNVESGKTLLFSFIGYETQKIVVGNQTQINISLSQDVETLEEVVVVGYGEQKKKVVTGAISSVSAEDLESLPINNVGQALQGRTAGLTMAAPSGQPGSVATIRVRGITTLNNNDPLWVVDGVIVDNGGIGYLNQSDIESIEVLKDAASQAIYGARAATGVILVTTKSGKKGGIKVNYNGYYGTSAPARKLDLLNAREYATLRNESSLAAGDGIVFENPQELGEGTDWQDQIFNNDARRQNHEVSISGANDVSDFYLSFGYLGQDGIVATDISKYERYNVRLNSTHKIKDWLTVGQNLGYSHEKSVGLGNTNSEYGGPLSSAINLDPTTPVYETDPDRLNSPLYPDDSLKGVMAPNGLYYGISEVVTQEMANPLAFIQTRLGNYNWSDNIVGNAYVELTPIEGLKIRSTIGTKLAFWGSESFTPEFYFNPSNYNARNSFGRSVDRKRDWNLENTISYSKKVGDHDFTVLLGQGAYRDSYNTSVNLYAYDLPINSFDEGSLGWNYLPKDTRGGGGEAVPHKVSSLFARVNYDYKERYMLTAVIRRDGSSNFGKNKRYGYFPSLSLGWNASDEPFWPRNEVVNFLKVRGGYGVVGNDNIGPLNFVSIIGGGRNYAFGNNISQGFSPNALANPDLQWEETTQINVGFEATVLQDFSVTFDWYKKITTGILRTPDIPGYVGTVSNPAVNIGDMENSGVELDLGYSKQIGKLGITVNGNVSYLHNEVTNLGSRNYYDEASFQGSTDPITRIAVGQPISSFYGYKIIGVFQNEAEIASYTNSEGQVIQPDAVPGDFKWADLDDSGSIDTDDRTFLGNSIPNWSYGLTVKLNYQNFDFTVFGQGVSGNQIFQGLRRSDIKAANYQKAALGRWTGEGTSNSYARLTDKDDNYNFGRPSDFYLEDGDYFRIKTVQLGYTLPNSMLSDVGITSARVYLMAENLFTFTKYTGYDPEIGGGVMSIDRGIYPQARSFMVGVSVSF